MADESATPLTLVAFEIAGVSYAIEIRGVREIIRPQAMDALPSANKGVVGVFDHRGDVVPVIDLRVRFDAPSIAATRETRWILVDHADHFVALIVDRVHEVFCARPEQARKVPELGGAASVHGGIRAAYSQRGRLVFLVDTQLLTDASALAQVLPPHALLRSEVR